MEIEILKEAYTAHQSNTLSNDNLLDDLFTRLRSLPVYSNGISIDLTSNVFDGAWKIYRQKKELTVPKKHCKR